MANETRANEHRDPTEIERDLTHTRESIDSTVEELGERLEPSQLVEDAKSYMKETAMRGASTIWSRINENAVPLGLIGGGLIWMMRSNGSDLSSGSERYRHTRNAPGSGGRAHEVTERVRESASEMSEGVKDVTLRAQQRARQSFVTMRDEQPLLLGMASLALGALAGGLLPTTRREDELLGGMRDEIVDTAAEASREKAEEARRAVEFQDRQRTGPRSGQASQPTQADPDRERGSAQERGGSQRNGPGAANERR